MLQGSLGIISDNPSGVAVYNRWATHSSQGWGGASTAGHPTHSSSVLHVLITVPPRNLWPHTLPVFGTGLSGLSGVLQMQNWG